MGTISPSQSSDGETIDAADINTPVNQLAAVINGNIETANLANAAVTTAKLANTAVTAPKIDFGGSGAGVWWEEIGRLTLTSAGDTLSISSLPARNHLKIMATALNSGQINMRIRFNGDTGTNYADWSSSDGGAWSGNVSQTSMVVGATVSANQCCSFDVLNILAQAKLIAGQGIGQNGAASSRPTSFDFRGKWVNTSAQISQVDLVNTGTGDFAIGSELIILGHN